MAGRRYKKKYSDYCATYDCSERTIARYAKAGFDLDNETNCWLQIKSQRSSKSNVVSFGTTGNATAPNAASINAGLGLGASIQRLQEAEATAHAEYAAATAAQNTALAGFKLKEWTTLAEQLRKTELSSPEVQEANKNTVPIAEVQKALYETFIRLRQDLETLPKRLGLELIGKDELGIREVIGKETEQILSALYHGKYLREGGEDAR